MHITVGYAALLTAVIVVGAANAVLLRKLLYTVAGEYVVALSVLLNTLATAVLLPLHLVMERRAGHRPQYDSPWYFFIAVALLDGAGSFLGLTGGSRTSGAVQLLLAKLDIPIAMALNLSVFRRALGASYHLSHYVGSAVVFAGIVVVALPPLLAGNDAHNTPDGIVLYTLSAVPFTVGEVLKESFSKRYHMDPVFIGAYSTPWQLVVSVASLPALLLPGVSELHSPRELGANLAHGLACVGLGAGDPGCGRAVALFVAYFVVNLCYNVLQLVAMRRGSAVVTSLAQGAIMPLASVVFAAPLVMGAAETVPLTWQVLVALVLVITGLGVYVCRREHPEVAAAAIQEIPLSRFDTSPPTTDDE